MPAPLTQEEAIKRAENLGKVHFIKWHGAYCGRMSKVEVTGSKCDHTWTASLHNILNGSGCTKCAAAYRSKVLKTDKSKCVENINALGRVAVIGWPYGYEGTRSKVTVRCLACSHAWDASVKNLLQGSGCPECAANHRGKKLIMPESDAVKRIERSGKYKFIQWVGVYESIKTAALVKCTSCGHSWSPKAHNLLIGTGCPACAINKQRTPAEQILKGINDSAGVAFIAWPNGYTGRRSRVTLKCLDCSLEWTTSLNSTLRGSGCPSCAKYGFDDASSGVLYVLMSHCGGFAKVGITNYFENRMRQLSSATPFEWSTLARIPCEVGKEARSMESEAHRLFDSAGFSNFDGATEWLKVTSGLLQWVLDKSRGTDPTR